MLKYNFPWNPKFGIREHQIDIDFDVLLLR